VLSGHRKTRYGRDWPEIMRELLRCRVAGAAAAAAAMEGKDGFIDRKHAGDCDNLGMVLMF